jgi:transcription antitermination factor NusG
MLNYIMKYWVVASYKINEIKRVERNLSNQNFVYFLPKIITKKFNSSVKEEVLFPGYIFINTSFEKYSLLKYTTGIKNVIKFGTNIPFLIDDEIKSIKMIEKASILDPEVSEVQIGQVAIISKGFLKGSMVKICSLPSKKRIDILLSILGSTRRVNIALNDLSL